MTVGAAQPRTHQDPLWRDRANYIFMAELKDERILGSAYSYEQMWGRKVTGEFTPVELCCVPFFVPELSLGDVVSLQKDASGLPVMRDVVVRSGRGVLRVVFVNPTRGREVVLNRIISAGGAPERSSVSYYAVSVDNADEQAAVEAVLTVEVHDGSLMYEVARTAGVS